MTRIKPKIEEYDLKDYYNIRHNFGSIMIRRQTYINGTRKHFWKIDQDLSYGWRHVAWQPISKALYTELRKLYDPKGEKPCIVQQLAAMNTNPHRWFTCEDCGDRIHSKATEDLCSVCEVRRGRDG